MYLRRDLQHGHFVPVYNLCISDQSIGIKLAGYLSTIAGYNIQHYCQSFRIVLGKGNMSFGLQFELTAVLANVT